VSPLTLNLSGRLDITSRALLPIEPVDPRITMFFMARLLIKITQGETKDKKGPLPLKERSL
jgi:hypothetical protein